MKYTVQFKGGYTLLLVQNESNQYQHQTPAERFLQAMDNIRFRFGAKIIKCNTRLISTITGLSREYVALEIKRLKQEKYGYDYEAHTMVGRFVESLELHPDFVYSQLATPMLKDSICDESENLESAIFTVYGIN